MGNCPFHPKQVAKYPCFEIILPYALVLNLIFQKSSFNEKLDFKKIEL